MAASTSVIINVGAATAGAVAELGKVETALQGNADAADRASREVKSEMDKMSASYAAMAADAKKSASKTDTALAGVGDGADTVASKGAQAAGALSGIGQVVGGPWGAAMVGAGTAMQFAADAGDLLNVAVEGGKAALQTAQKAWTSFAKATKLQTAATKVAAVVQAAFNAVMAANPIVLIILAIIALIAAIVLLWKNWDKVTDFLRRTWNWIKQAATQVWGAIRDYFVKVWNSIRDTAIAVWDRMRTAFADKMNALVDFVKDLPSRIVRALGNFGSLLYGKGRDLMQGLINGIKSMASAILNAILGLLPGPLRSAIRGAVGFSVPATPALSASRTGPSRIVSAPRNVTINIMGTGDPIRTGATIKRMLETNDIAQGRPRGMPLALAW